MKKYLKYSGICAALFAIVAFILVMVGVGIQLKGDGVTVDVETAAGLIFGSKHEGILDNGTYKPAATSLIGWILLLVGLVIVILGIVLPLLKVNALEKFAGVLNLVAVGCFVTAGVLFFFGKGAWYAANDMDVPDSAVLTGNVIVGGILSIVAGAFAILPAAFDFVGNKKK
ncbi:MAG: hypothetical protein IJ247_05875 [Bacilli bacterium]|nr:hypothetical protein [Bacilli bacterium]